LRIADDRDVYFIVIFRDYLAGGVAQFGKGFDSGKWSDFARRIRYFKGNLETAGDYRRLHGYLKNMETGPADRLYYLAVAPEFYGPACDHLAGAWHKARPIGLGILHQGTGKEPTCQLAPEPFENVLPVNEITWGGTEAAPDAVNSPFPNASQVVLTPLVANLDDDSGDGLIDECLPALGTDRATGRDRAVAASLDRPDRRQIRTRSLAGQLDDERLHGLASGLDLDAIVGVQLEGVRTDGDVAQTDDVELSLVHITWLLLLVAVDDPFLPEHLAAVRWVLRESIDLGLGSRVLLVGDLPG